MEVDKMALGYSDREREDVVSTPRQDDKPIDLRLHHVQPVLSDQSHPSNSDRQWECPIRHRQLVGDLPPPQAGVSLPGDVSDSAVVVDNGDEGRGLKVDANGRDWSEGGWRGGIEEEDLALPGFGEPWDEEEVLEGDDVALLEGVEVRRVGCLFIRRGIESRVSNETDFSPWMGGSLPTLHDLPPSALTSGQIATTPFLPIAATPCPSHPQQASQIPFPAKEGSSSSMAGEEEESDEVTS
jgi:hypothetical protein